VHRLFSTALLVALLGATAVAFVITEGLKLEPSPVTKVFVTKIFSPTCECRTDLALIHFRLRKPDRMTLAIVDGGDRLVRTLVGPVTQNKGPVSASWDGRDEAGSVVSDGDYMPRIHLRHRTILMQNRMRVDTTPPVLRLRHVGPRLVEPGKRLKVRYLVSEPARIRVFLNGRRVLLGRSTRLRWKVESKVGGRPGRYRLTAAARDVAGNLSRATRPVTIVIPLRLLTRRVRTAVGGRFSVRVVSDGRAYHWKLGRGSGFASARRLVLRAPPSPGHYGLVIRQDKLAHLVPVVVTP
jgi:hypothetical protein